MKRINRSLTTICSDDLEGTRRFYTRLFDFRVTFESDWFIHLVSEDKHLELGLIRRDSDLVPPEFQTKPQGFYVTFVVDDVDALLAMVRAERFELLEAPHDTPYGQRRMLLKDPNGALVDVSAPIPNFAM